MMITDGKALDVVLTSTKAKNDPHYDAPFHGILMADGVSGDTVAMEIAQRVHRINAGELSVSKGTKLYFDSDGVLTTTEGSNKLAFIAIEAKDDNDLVDVLILPQA